MAVDETNATECNPTDHIFHALDVSEKTGTAIKPKYVLYCSKCGKTKDLK